VKTKFVKVRDHWTVIHFLVLQFEEVDKESGFAPGLKVALQVDGRGVSCIGGYDLREQFGATIQSLSRPMDNNGTTVAFKEVLHFVDNVRALPDEIDVEDWREEFFGLKGDYYFMPPDVRQILAEYPHHHLRKVAYRRGYALLPEVAPTLHLAIIDVHDKELLTDIGSSPELLEFRIAQFLWIPLEMATEDELKGFDLGPLAKDVLTIP
jgi:hypothetical protein